MRYEKRDTTWNPQFDRYKSIHPTHHVIVIYTLLTYKLYDEGTNEFILFYTCATIAKPATLAGPTPCAKALTENATPSHPSHNTELHSAWSVYP